jgi:hypothetical protein
MKHAITIESRQTAMLGCGRLFGYLNAFGLILEQATLVLECNFSLLDISQRWLETGRCDVKVRCFGHQGFFFHNLMVKKA